MLNIGDVVRMVNCREARMHEGKTWIVRSEPWECCGCTMIALKGKSGGFDVNCLEKVES